MADGLNKVLLMGALGADPELRFTASGQAVLNIRMATSERYKDNKTNEWKEKTEWHSVTIWGARGEALGKILRKGASIFVEGSLHTSSYEDKKGEKRYKTEINASNIVLCGGKGEQRTEGERPPATRAPANRTGEYAPDVGGGFADPEDVPF